MQFLGKLAWQTYAKPATISNELLYTKDYIKMAADSDYVKEILNIRYKLKICIMTKSKDEDKA